MPKVYEWSKGESNDKPDPNGEFDAVEYLDVEDRSWTETVGSEQVDEVRRSEVEIDVFQAEQGREQDATGQ